MTDQTSPTHPDNPDWPALGEWKTFRTRCANRTVLRVERWKYRVTVRCEPPVGAVSLGDFRAWVKRTEATPTPEYRT